MTIAQYLHIVEVQLHVLLGVDGDHLLVVSAAPLPREAAQALAGYSAQLVNYFHEPHADTELDVAQLHRDLKDLGLMQLPTGDWTHPLGDQMCDQIIAGVLTSPAETTRDRVVLEGRPARWPRKTKVTATRIGPGRFAWVEPKGQRCVPVFDGNPLLRSQS